MSALTKIAIVLLVVASLLLSAGVVVFVNKVEDWQQLAKAQQSNYAKEQETTKSLMLEVLSVRNASDAQMKSANAALDAAKAESASKDPIIAGLKADKDRLTQEKAGVEATVATMTGVQAGLQGQLAAGATQITALRQSVDRLNEERHSLNSQLTDALSKLEVVTRAYNNEKEKSAAARAAYDDLKTKVLAAGFTEMTLPKRSSEGMPSLEGVVQGVFTAGNKPWATISIGSKDMVEKGMQFKVVNNNEFLGYLTIQTTEPKEAAGVLDGPRVEKVRTGDQVKTQLQ